MNQETILMLDDNPQILYTLEQICLFQNWKPLPAQNFEQALEYIRTSAIDLILVDYHMPDINGIQAVRKIRELLPNTPILVLTIEEEETVVNKFLEVGADDYALKPIRTPDLIARMKMHLKYSERRKFYEDNVKGINPATMETNLQFFSTAERFYSVDEIEAQTKIKKKTLYRYLRQLQTEHKIEEQLIYQKAGRPKTLYGRKQ